MDTRDKKRRNKTIRVGVAALALLGIGAAITTAAWTDQVWFSAEANAATFDLEGSDTAAGPWADYDTAGGALVIPIAASQFGDLVPGTTAKEVTVYVKNASSVDATLQVVADRQGELFSTSGTTVTVDAIAGDTTLSPQEVTGITVTLTPGEMPATLQGKTGTVLVSVTGSTP